MTIAEQLEQKGFEKGFKQGFEQGFKEGFKQGFKQSVEQFFEAASAQLKADVIRAMLENSFTAPEIMQMTGLSEGDFAAMLKTFHNPSR